MLEESSLKNRPPAELGEMYISAWRTWGDWGYYYRWEHVGEIDIKSWKRENMVIINY